MKRHGYERIIKEPGSHRVVNIGLRRGKNVIGRVSVGKIPESPAEALELLRDIKGLGDDPNGVFARGTGDQYILDNDCDLYYYIDGRHEITIKIRHGRGKLKRR